MKLNINGDKRVVGTISISPRSFTPSIRASRPARIVDRTDYGHVSNDKTESFSRVRITKFSDWLRIVG